MYSLPGFWHGAAALSGRIDLSVARSETHKISALSSAKLRAATVSERHCARLQSTPPLHVRTPFLTLGEPSYPEHMACMPFAPPVLFYRGNRELLASPAVALVGARKCTQRGREMATELARGLSRAGLTIVSGLAYGIDEAAHSASPDRAIAVLGQGLSATLSSRQERLMKQILDAGGLILSEFLPSRPASKHTFPQRNRVISGLSLGTVVIEATLRSGSRITARHALEQGREVMAVPGHPRDQASSGCNDLIASGAALIRCTDDVLNQLRLEAVSEASDTPTCSIQRRVLEALETGQSLDHIAAVTGLEIPVLMVSIQALELTGHLARLPGDRLTLRKQP